MSHGLFILPFGGGDTSVWWRLPENGCLVHLDFYFFSPQDILSTWIS